MPKPNKALIQAATAGSLGADFFLKEPTGKQRVMTRFDAIAIATAQSKRDRRRLRKYLKGVVDKTTRADVVIVGPGQSESAAIVRAVEATRQSPPRVAIIGAEPPPTSLMAALVELHRQNRY